METERRDTGGQRSMAVIESVDDALRRVLPTAPLRLVYRVGHLALRPYWLLARPKVVGSKVVVRCGDNVLLLRHSYARRHVWDLPGGFVHPSERAVDAVSRELREELAIEPRSIRCIARESAANDGKRETLLTFVAEVDDPAIEPNRAEIDQARWFPAGDLPPSATTFVRRMVARAGWPEPMLEHVRTR